MCYFICIFLCICINKSYYPLHISIKQLFCCLKAEIVSTNLLCPCPLISQMAVTVHWCPISRNQPSAVHLSCPTAMDQAMPNSTGEMVSTVFCVPPVINGARSAPSQGVSVIQVSLTVSQQSVKVNDCLFEAWNHFVFIRSLWTDDVICSRLPFHPTRHPFVTCILLLLIFLLDNGVSRGKDESLTRFTRSVFAYSEIGLQSESCRITLNHGKAHFMRRHLTVWIACIS